MKKLLSLFATIIFASSAISAAGVITTTSQINIKQNENTILTFSNQNEFNENLAQVAEEFFAKDVNNENKLKQAVNDALNNNNGQMSLDLSKLEFVKNDPIYSYLTHDYFLENFKQNENSMNSMTNIEINSFSTASISNFSSGVWAEYRWYWGIYWRLHLDANTSRIVSDWLAAGSAVGGIAAIIANINPIAKAAIEAAIIFLNWVGSPLGKGAVAIAFVGPVPVDSWLE